MRLAILSLCALGIVAGCAPRTTVGSQPSADLMARARDIHQRVITIDTHKDIPNNFATPEADPKTMNSQVNLDKMKAGGYDMAFFAVYVGQGARTDSGNAFARDRALRKYGSANISGLKAEVRPEKTEFTFDLK